jgi:hypothetical protein
MVTLRIRTEIWALLIMVTLTQSGMYLYKVMPVGIVVIPVLLGKGRTMFEGIQEKVNLRLVKTRTFQNGNVLLCYQPGLILWEIFFSVKKGFYE